MKIGLAADHRGYKLKESIKVFLQEKGYAVVDVGTYNFERTDHPLIAEKLCKKVLEEEVALGIAVCGTGIGMSIVCNKIDGIYCAKVNSVNEARLAKEHNDCNVLALKGNMFSYKAKRIVMRFIKADFDVTDEAYQIRINQIKRIEKKN